VTPDVSVVIVTYESRGLVERCLRALDRDARGAATSREVIVVDQGSADGTAAWLRDARPDVRLVALDENLGFGPGNNRGLEVARGRWAFLLNSDGFVEPGAIDELVRFGDAQPRAGAVGPRLRFGDGRLQRSCRGFPTPFRVATEYLFLRQLRPGSPRLNAFYCGGFDHRAARRVDWLTGAALLVRRAALAEVGGFDERFFMYSEEVDLLRRLDAAGWETWFDPAAEVVHLWGATADRDAGRSFREQLRSHVRYASVHLGPRQAARVRRVLLLGLALRAPRGPRYREALRWLAARDVDELLAGGRGRPSR
jgi:GT2 family glycosyltransferase